LRNSNCHSQASDVDEIFVQLLVSSIDKEYVTNSNTVPADGKTFSG
jgi:hypothetical protein